MTKISADLDRGQDTPDPRRNAAPVDSSRQPGHRDVGAQTSPAGLADLSGYRALRVLAEMFYDAQENRKRVANRAGRFAQAEGTPDKHVLPEWLAFEIANAEHEEKRLGKLLVAQYHDVAPKGVITWQESSPGIGAHLTARLLGHLGHPRVAEPYHWEGTGAKRHLVADEPYERSVSQLWAYCGHGDPERRGFSKSAEENFAAGSPTLKMLVWNMATCAFKQPGRSIKDLLNPDHGHPGTQEGSVGVEDPSAAAQGANDTQAGLGGGDPSDTAGTTPVTAPMDFTPWPYRAVYEQRRLATVGRVHAKPCVRCGPSGKPAQPGSTWSDAHAQADALRIVGKTILADMWRAT